MFLRKFPVLLPIQKKVGKDSKENSNVLAHQNVRIVDSEDMTLQTKKDFWVQCQDHPHRLRSGLHLDEIFIAFVFEKAILDVLLDTSYKEDFN